MRLRTWFTGIGLSSLSLLSLAVAQPPLPPSRPVHVSVPPVSVRMSAGPATTQHQGHEGVATAPAAVAGDKAVGRRFTEPVSVPGLSAEAWNPGPDDQQLTAPQSLQQLLESATVHNPTLIQARLHINSQLGKAVQAGLYPNPTVAAVGEQIGLEGTAGEWVGAEIEQRFVTGGKLRLSRNKYLQRARVAEYLAMAQQYRVCNDIRTHFFRTVAAKQIFDLQRELLKTAEDGLLTAREMYNLGQANQADLHQVTAMLQEHRLAVLQAHNRLRAANLDLASLVGLPFTSVEADGTLIADRAVINFAEASVRLLEGSPEVLAAAAKLREDGITLARERVEWIPDIRVSAGPGYNNVDRQTTVAARVAIEVPLYDRNQGTIDQAKADYHRQVREIQRQKLKLQQKLTKEYSAYMTARQHNVEYQTVILPAKREAYRLQLQSYKRARSEWPDVLNAQEEYTKARIALIHHQMQQRVSEALIDGFLLSGGLDAPDGPLPSGHIDSVPKPR